jgi:hypothetical protein
MKVSLNLRTREVPPELNTLQDVIAYIEQQLVAEGQTITRILLDGETLEEEDERSRGDTPVAEINIVEFYSARPIDLTVEGLGFATELLPGLADDLHTSAVQTRSGNLQQGLATFAECLEYLGWYVRIVESAHEILTQRDPGFQARAGDGDGGCAESPEEELSQVTSETGPELRTFASRENLRQKLEDIINVQRNQDTVLLADMIEYELLPIVKIWMSEVATLLKLLERESGTA